MSSLLISAFVTALVSGVVASLLVPPILKLAEAMRTLDHPTEPRKVEGRFVPRLGGVALAGGIAAGGSLGLLSDWHSWAHGIPRSELVALPIAAGLVFLVGLLDDLFGVSAAKKFLVQFLAAWLLVRLGWTIQILNLPFVGEIDLGAWGGLVSLVWIVGVTNAINLIDGLDGLAGGVAAIIAASLLVFSLLVGNAGTVVLLAAIFGACLGFLRHNWEPARVFMGDSGSLTLGFLLGAFSLHSSIKARAAVAILVPILALGLPVIDTLLVMAVRFLQGKGWSMTGRVGRMFRADRQHLHHLLGNLVQHRSQVVKTLYALVLLFCGGAVAVAVTGNGTLGLVLVLLQVVAVLTMRRLGMARQARELAAERLEALRMQRPNWLQTGARVTPDGRASRDGDLLGEPAPREAPAAKLPPAG
jgi:UDP-GlcNAc:undecaprenyl-phosphate/decaprenyl-phosphate GlcNAc-1-phosphate transferase